jgi:NTP pyrophosphatase (non-canonical NTP hydrolase)
MDFNEYQKKALSTVISHGDYLKDTMHWVLGINGEAGEVAEKVKKIIRDKNGVVSEQDKEDIAKELGDVLWYLAVFADQLGFNFEKIAQDNLDKLQRRKANGTLSGSGDNR